MPRLSIALLLLSSCAPTPTRPPPRPAVPAAPVRGDPATAPPMRAHFIDVGQGDATLLEFPCGAVLVDTGAEQNPLFDGVAALERYLDTFFAARPELGGRLDSLILTHSHIDHVRGVDMVLRKYTPKNIVTNGVAEGLGRSRQLEAHEWGATLEKEGRGTFTIVRAGNMPPDGLTTPAIDPVDCAAQGVNPDIRAFWGDAASAAGGWSAKDRDNGNNNSIVLRVDYGGAAFMLMGDLEEAGIRSLLDLHPQRQTLDVDVLKVGHHGSYNATTDALLARLTPKVAVIMMGPEARHESWTAWDYGHPRLEAIERLERGVGGSRSPAAVKVGTGKHSFIDRTITAAIYATGWQGSVVVEASAKGMGRVEVVGSKPAEPLALARKPEAPGDQASADRVPTDARAAEPLVALAQLANTVADNQPQAGGSIRAKRDTAPSPLDPEALEARVVTVRAGRFPLVALRLSVTKAAGAGPAAQVKAGAEIVVVPRLAVVDGKVDLSDPASAANAGAWYLRVGDRVGVRLSAARGDGWEAEKIERR